MQVLCSITFIVYKMNIFIQSTILFYLPSKIGAFIPQMPTCPAFFTRRYNLSQKLEEYFGGGSVPCGGGYVSSSSFKVEDVDPSADRVL